MHNILSKKLGDLLKIYRCGDIFKSLGTFLMSFRPVELHFYHIKINRWVKTNQIAVFYHVMTHSYKSLMTIMITFNAI